MNKPVYLLSVFYQDAKKQKADLAKIPVALKQVSAGDFIAVQYDSHQVGFLFSSSFSHQDLRKSLDSLHAEKLQLLLVEAKEFVATNISAEVIRWLGAHQVAIQR